MPFNKNITGFQNEDELIHYINRKRMKELNPMYQSFLYDLFDDICSNSIVYAKPVYDKQKADMCIQIGSQKKWISIKKGIKNSVHVESVTNFIKFLKNNDISQSIIDKVLKYHYADGTTDGSGKKRMSVEEYKKDHQMEIHNINLVLNQETILRNAINRFVLIGNNRKQPIDAILYGVIDDFIWIKKDDIINMILSRKNLNTTSIHFGSLFYQPLNRCLNDNVKYESARHKIQIKWYHLSDDIIETMNQNVLRKNHMI